MHEKARASENQASACSDVQPGRTTSCCAPIQLHYDKVLMTARKSKSARRNFFGRYPRIQDRVLHGSRESRPQGIPSKAYHSLFKTAKVRRLSKTTGMVESARLTRPEVSYM